MGKRIIGSKTVSMNQYNILESYMKDIRKVPLLSREEEFKTAREARDGNKAARDRLITANLRFVLLIAKKYQGRGIPLTDLINEGNLGLFKAIEHFDADRGFRFISYAVHWIRQSIIIAIAEKGKFIRTPLSWNSQFVQIEKVRKSFGDNQIPKNELMEIARELGLEPDRINELIILGQEIISLEQTASDSYEPSQIKNLVASENYLSPEALVIANSLHDDISRVLETLPEKEATIIKARYGLDNGNVMTLSEIGALYNISKEAIRQIESKALKRLRQSAQKWRLDAYITSA